MWHNRLTGRVGLWVASFLDPATRKQAVGVEGRISELVPVISGVPQGTVLGPILFLIHIRCIGSNRSPGTSTSSFADDTKVWRPVRSLDDCSALQSDLQAIYDWANRINMEFNSGKFEWLRYAAVPEQSPIYQYQSPNSSCIEQKQNLRDLGVRLSSDMSFSLHIEKVVTTASQMVGWGLRTFRTRRSYLLLTMFKTLVQPHLDYCCQLWCPADQGSINKIEGVQRSLLSRIREARLEKVSYWDKLRILKLYSQERRRERYLVIFIWKISQGLVEGYDLSYTNLDSRTGRKAIPHHVDRSAPACVRRARERSLGVKGVQLFNLLPVQLRNSEHGDLEMFKNHLDIYLSNIPDQPTIGGLTRPAETNSLLHQIPMYENLN